MTHSNMRKLIFLSKWNFFKIEIALRHGCSPVNLLHIFRTSFPRNTSGWLLPQQQNTSSHQSSHNASVEARHPSHNASAEVWLPHSVTTAGAQQNLQNHNASAGVRSPDNKIVPLNNTEKTDDDTERTPSLLVDASYL